MVRTPYEEKRRTLLGDIFEYNHEIWDDIDPYTYHRDVYDTLLEEQYLLYEGGEKAVEWAKDQAKQTLELLNEYEFSDRMKMDVEELARVYMEYANNYANKKGETVNA